MSQQAINEAKLKLDDAVWIGHLVGWIERARFLCDNLAMCAELDKSLESALHANNIAFRDAGWDSEQSDGLGRMVLVQRKLMEEAIEVMEARHA